MKKQDILENQVNYAYLALGSNLGKKIKNLEFAKYKLTKIGINIVKSSSFYITKSWTNTKFQEIVNSDIFIKTKLILQDLFIGFICFFFKFLINFFFFLLLSFDVLFFCQAN